MEKLETGGEPKVITPSRTHFIVGTLLLVLGVAALIGWCAWGNPKSGIQNSYGVVFDAGSTGTRLYVYCWPGGKVNGTGLVHEFDDCGGGEALSSFETHPHDAGLALEVCINRTTVPRQKVTRAFLGATAGMRLVDERNSSISDAILWWIRDYLRNTLFDFRDDDARIIDGSEEGISGWISINYIMENLQEGQKSLARCIRSLYTTETNKATVGALDLGGASMQISFIPYQAESISHDSIHKLRLFGVNYHVYSHSYLCYGAVEARRRYLADIIKDAGFNEVVIDPCGHVGFNETVEQEYVWSPPCTKRPNGIPANISFTLVGKSNAEECRRKVFSLITASDPCTHQSCGLHGVFQPPPYGQFLAFSGFYYTTSGVGLGENASMAEFNQTGIDFCHRSWKDVKEINKIKYVKAYCFNINYVYAVLVKGFKFTDDLWNIKFAKKVNNISLSWSLGFMLNTTNMIPAEAPETSAAFVIVSVIFVVLAVIGLSLIIYKLRKRG